MMDPIDRQQAIDAVKGVVISAEWEYAEEALEKLPSVQQIYTCDGCKHYGMWENEVEYGYHSPCTRCKRRGNDNYEQ